MISRARPVNTGVVAGAGVINSCKGANYITSSVTLCSAMRLWDLDYDPHESSLRFSLSGATFAIAQYPCRLKDREDDQPNDRGRSDEQWAAYSPNGTRPRDCRRRIHRRLCGADVRAGAGEQRNRRAAAAKTTSRNKGCRKYRPMSSTASSASRQIVTRQQPAAITHCSQSSIPSMARRQDKWTIRAITAGLTPQKLAVIQPRPPQWTLSRVERSDDRKIRQYERPSAGPYPPEPATQLTMKGCFTLAWQKSKEIGRDV
jgi:hypothetical protein